MVANHVLPLNSSMESVRARWYVLHPWNSSQEPIGCSVTCERRERCSNTVGRDRESLPCARLMAVDPVLELILVGDNHLDVIARAPGGAKGSDHPRVPHDG